MLAFYTSGFSQIDPHFSQFYANPLYLNPAFAGSNICPRLILNYRNQWPSIPGFVTYNASYDQYFDAIHGGLGLLVNNDNEGGSTLTTTTVNLLYAYNLDVTSKFSIKAGFEASYFWNKLDWSKLVFGDQISANIGYTGLPSQEKQPDNLSKSSIDFSAGLLGYSDKVYFGIAANHLTEPNVGFYSTTNYPLKLTAHAGFIIPLEGRDNGTTRESQPTTISPNVLFLKQQDFEELNFGMYFNKYPFVGGLWYRQSLGVNPLGDAVIVLVGLQTGMIKFGYSYDITVSKLTLAAGGAHEISFAFLFGCPPKKQKIRVINCPTF